ncbi:hypothetical protein HPP92_018360 [Vanilla planifolia]|uniref:Uncharacterized protein n=1 Tax=Vanilla planifolia TaxID=51239 RepID=A0A835Q6Q1_VANPL|nr:hypothetical protein HPP92_018971 [Vanilla planifolia]KAG0469032.1 hypothetical protein HPP92_018360 [Vanilla planifolia]
MVGGRNSTVSISGGDGPLSLVPPARKTSSFESFPIVWDLPDGCCRRGGVSEAGRLPTIEQDGSFKRAGRAKDSNLANLQISARNFAGDLVVAEVEQAQFLIVPFGTGPVMLAPLMTESQAT